MIGRPRDAGHVIAQLPQREHLQPPVPGGPGARRALGQAAQRRVMGRLPPRAPCPAAPGHGRAPRRLRRARPHRARGVASAAASWSRAAYRCMASSAASSQARPARGQSPAAAACRASGLGLAGQQVSRPAVVGQPGGLGRAGVDDLLDQVVGEFIVAPADHEQPGLPAPAHTSPAGGGRRSRSTSSGLRSADRPKGRGPPRRAAAPPRPSRSAGRGPAPRCAAIRDAGVARGQRLQHLDYEQRVPAGALPDVIRQCRPARPARGQLPDRGRVQAGPAPPGWPAGPAPSLICGFVLGADRHHGQQPGARVA